MVQSAQRSQPPAVAPALLRQGAVEEVVAMVHDVGQLGPQPPLHHGRWE